MLSDHLEHAHLRATLMRSNMQIKWALIQQTDKNSLFNDIDSKKNQMQLTFSHGKVFVQNVLL